MLPRAGPESPGLPAAENGKKSLIFFLETPEPLNAPGFFILFSLFFYC
jgi:hypothetical protein